MQYSRVLRREVEERRSFAKDCYQFVLEAEDGVALLDTFRLEEVLCEISYNVSVYLMLLNF